MQDLAPDQLNENLQGMGVRDIYVSKKPYSSFWLRHWLKTTGLKIAGKSGSLNNPDLGTVKTGHSLLLSGEAISCTERIYSMRLRSCVLEPPLPLINWVTLVKSLGLSFIH